MQRTVVACVSDFVAVAVFLVGIRNIRTVVFIVQNTVAVAVYCSFFAGIADAVSVAVSLCCIRIERAVVALIADFIAVRVCLAVTGNKRTFILAVHKSVAVRIYIGNVASADSRFCFVRIGRTQVFNIAVRFFVVFVGFRFGFRFIVFIRFFCRIGVFLNDNIGKFFIGLFGNVVVVRQNRFRIC